APQLVSEPRVARTLELSRQLVAGERKDAGLEQQPASSGREHRSELITSRVFVAHPNKTLELATVTGEAIELALSVGPEGRLQDQAHPVPHRSRVVEDTAKPERPLGEVIAPEEAITEAASHRGDDVNLSGQITHTRARTYDVIVKIADRRAPSPDCGASE